MNVYLIAGLVVGCFLGCFLAQWLTRWLRGKRPPNEFEAMRAEMIEQRIDALRIAALNTPDPTGKACETCNSIEGVAFYPTGSLAKWTALCPSCFAALQRQTREYWAGFAAMDPAKRKAIFEAHGRKYDDQT